MSNFNICITLFTLFHAGCELIAAPKGVTCAQLRRLTLGMTEPEVAAILGPPLRRFPSEPYYPSDPPTDPITWDYSNNSLLDGGVRLHVRFVHGRLKEADSWIRTVWRDLRDEGPRPTLFSLDAAGIRTEGAEFKRVYCSSSQ